ncbi:glycosyltransferase family 4 protein [Fontimonas sp. SYSU GA230001]|uniref:glycosyltransferase family 4 protein n=1 Tax=Fontimonas sp. SYSU GA230001 TaxID=3142450 RepID=UPI0032B4003F
MRILLIHSHYRSSMPSGENVSFQSIRNLLAEAGHVVETFERHSDDIAATRPLALFEAALLTPWNPLNHGRLARTVAHFRPDLAHVENTFPLLSPSVYWTLARLGVPTVASIRNYRSWCAAGIAYRDGMPCRACLDRASVRPALQHGCYRASRPATVPLAATIALHRRLGTLKNKPRLLIANSAFMRQSLIESGIPGDRIVAVPNFVRDSGATTAWKDRDHRVLFVGRLDPEKGAADLVRAWALLPEAAPSLEIIGDGPQRRALEALAAAHGPSGRVHFTGRLDPAEVSARMARAKLIAFPSRWYETFGRGVIEAYAHAVPALVARIGALPELVEPGRTGEIFAPGDAADLASCVQRLFADESRLQRMAQLARARYAQNYSPGVVLERLQAAYAQALGTTNTPAHHG